MFVKMPPDYAHTLVRLKDDPAEERYQADLVRMSIKDIEVALEKFREIESNPRSTKADRQHARECIAYRQRDFGGQWSNVKAILLRIPG